TPRCFKRKQEGCGWERQCSGEPGGGGGAGGASAPCAEIPRCDLHCPEGSPHPIDANGCIHTCDCGSHEGGPGGAAEHGGTGGTHEGGGTGGTHEGGGTGGTHEGGGTGGTHEGGG